MPYTTGILIPAYNEEKNIKHTITEILKQKLPKNFKLKRVLVVSSGSYDNTNNILKSMVKKNKKLSFIIQKKRTGKINAIKAGIKKLKGDFLVIENADTKPAKNAISNLLKCVCKKGIGMAGGRAQPIDSKRTLTGFYTNLVWQLHHKISKSRPKMGELIAFRNILKPEEIPTNPVDEATLEMLIYKKGYKIAYCPKSVVKLKGPGNLSEIFEQRRRIMNGHLHLKARNNYLVSTMRLSLIMPTLLSCVPKNPKHFIYYTICIFTEFLARLMGCLDFCLGRNPYVWKIAKTSKKVIDQ